MPQPVIEPATDDDIDAIVTYWIRLARDQRSYDSAILAEENRERMRQVLAAHRFDDRLLVARVGGVLAGFASFSLEQGSLELETNRGFLSNLYVRPSYRNQGIGTELLAAVESELEERGAEELLLETMAANEDARRFYREAGYDPFRIEMKRSLEDRPENDTHSKDEE